MDPGRASMTAMGTALMRAAHTRLDEPPLLDDPWGDRLIPREQREAMLASGGREELDTALRAHPSYGTVILRARYAEDALAEAVARGVRQYVIVGAGMDSFALRRPAFARDLEVFEVDHPATQEFKTGRLAECEIPPPAGLHLVAADLGETTLDAALAGSAFREDRPAFFSWLGVTPYLTRAANLTTLAAIASCGLAGSELVFSFVDQALLDADAGDGPMAQARAQVAAVGEPWISGFHPGELGQDVRGAGLELLEVLGPAQLGERYCAGRGDGLSPSPGSHLAHARVLA
jgi:methyltransferase (TIGR00027 family)